MLRMSAFELLLSSVPSAVLILVLFVLFKGPIRRWIAKKVEASIQHKYDEKLEKIKGEISIQNETKILQISNDMQLQKSFLESIRASFLTGQQSSIERKLVAVDRLWKEVLEVRKLLAAQMSWIDIFGEDETEKYKEFRESAVGAQFLAKKAPEEAKESLESISSEMEDIRPYVSEYLWALFHSYKIIHYRVFVSLQVETEGCEGIDWYKDKGTYGIISTILDENELHNFDELQYGKFSWLVRSLEYKILVELRKIISGQHFAEDALEKAGASVMEKIKEAEPKKKM